MAAFLGQALEEEGHVVDVAHDGATGEHLAMSSTFDLVILDFLLPRRNGIEVCRRMRGAGRMTPILMLTARGANARSQNLVTASVPTLW